MGELRFQVTALGALPQHVVQRAYLVSLEGIPWISHNSVEDDVLVLSRDTSESARLLIPWHVPGYGEYVLKTATLVERARPYQLSLELARGTLHEIREYLAVQHDLDEPAEHPQAATLQEALDTFVEAVTSVRDPARVNRLADECLQLCIHWAQANSRQQSAQSVAVTQRRAGEIPTVFGVVLDDSQHPTSTPPAWHAAANTLISPAVWRHMESQPAQRRWEQLDAQLDWAERLGMSWGVGPLLSWTRESLPDWLSLWEEDYETLQSHMVQQVQAVVKRYRGRARFWHVVHRVNTAMGLNITEQQRLELSAAAVDAARNVDRQTPILVSFEQPWHEYLALHRHEATPLDYAEALVRAKLGLGALGLEINLGYWPGGTGRRLPLEVERVLSLWGRLGLPLVIFLAAPSDSTRDPMARSPVQPVTWGVDEPSGESQATLIEQWCRLLMDHDSVWGVVWKQVSDQTLHELPHAGLLDATGRPKPLCDRLATLRANLIPGPADRGPASDAEQP